MVTTKARLLVIDDEPDLLALTVEGLRFEGLEVSFASGGLAGLQMIREELPDLVICDINMPDMDGFEVLSHLRNDSLTAAIPFIFLSALAEHEEIRAGMAQGADDYLTKPVDFEDLLQAIHSRLNRQANLEMSRLREFAHRLVIAQEKERHNFAITLKDNLAEKLSDLKLSLDTMQRLGANMPPQALNKAAKMVGETLNTINNLSYALWPSVLNHFGLEAALLTLYEQLQENSDFVLEFEHYELESIQEPQAMIMLYRIVQEALENIKNHAGVQQAQLKLWVEDAQLHLQIEDAGIGFDLQGALNQAEKIGLRSMLERAYLLNGELTIISAPQEGSHIYGHFPLNSTPSPTKLSKIPVKAPETKLNTNSLRLAIADSNELNRWGYRAIIESDNRFNIVAELSDWASLRRMLEDIDLDILLVSQTLEGEEQGLLQLAEVHELYPNVRILLLSNYSEYAFAAQALKNGISAYLLKSSSSGELRAALEALSKGKQYLSSALIPAKQAVTGANKLDVFTTLTEREREIFYRVVNGQSNQAIADELYLSSRTVETHRLNMMRKLGLTGTAALVNFALNKGLLRGKP